MANKIYLVSGHTSSGGLQPIDERILAETDGKKVLVLNLAASGKDKLANRREAFHNYFTQVGADNVDFVSEETSYASAEHLFQKADLLYLPGGDTLTLMNNVKTKCLESLISSFNGIIEGNSAGAYILCPEYLRIRDGELEVFPTMGLIEFWVKAHYEPKFDSTLQELSKGRKIYALQNESAVVHGKRLGFIGDVWKFCEGTKEKVN